MRENLPHFSGCHTRNTVKPTEHRAPGLLAFNHNRHAGPQVCDGLNRAGPHFKSADIVAEQEKLLWADTVIFQFPLWWFSMPAIMKGWIDRVYAWGFAYGVGEHSDRHWGDRYGEGTFVGKRAMLIVTAGGWAEHYSPRGINGPIDDILFPIQHGMLFYPGFEVLPPLVFYRTDKTDAGQFADQCAALAERLDTLWQTEPIPFRRQNHGDYLIPSLTLRPELAPGQSGLAVHLRSE